MKRTPTLADLPDQTNIMFRETLNVYQQIHLERVHSIEKHKEHAQDNLTIDDPNLFYNLAEEFGEVAHALTYDGADGLLKLRKELIQVAAMAIAWAEVIDL